MTTIDAASSEREAAAGKYAANDDCWKLFAATGTLADATYAPFASYSTRFAVPVTALRFTRPMFVRYDAFAASAVRYIVASRSGVVTSGTACPYVPKAPFVNVRLDVRMSGVDDVFVASIAIAPAPDDNPKISSSAFAYVTDCFAPRKIVRVSIEPLLPGTKIRSIDVASPALKSVSSVRQTDPPMPFVCALADTSERVVNDACVTTIVCAIVLDDVAFDVVRVTTYMPALLYACVGRCAFDPAPSPKLHDHDVGEPLVVSSKLTVCAVVGFAGDQPKPAATGGVTGAPFDTTTTCDVCDD